MSEQSQNGVPWWRNNPWYGLHMFRENRDKFPAEELLKYNRQYIAWIPDGSGIFDSHDLVFSNPLLVQHLCDCEWSGCNLAQSLREDQSVKATWDSGGGRGRPGSQVVFLPTDDLPCEQQIMATKFNCLHCSTLVTAREIKEGWCDSCGKQIPYSIQCEAKTTGALSVSMKDDYDEPRPGNGRRLLVSGLAFVSFLAFLAVTVLKLG